MHENSFEIPRKALNSMISAVYVSCLSVARLGRLSVGGGRRGGPASADRAVRRTGARRRWQRQEEAGRCILAPPSRRNATARTRAHPRTPPCNTTARTRARILAPPSRRNTTAWMRTHPHTPVSTQYNGPVPCPLYGGRQSEINYIIIIIIIIIRDITIEQPSHFCRDVFTFVAQTVVATPRKRCVVELHARLLYLLRELEPWESKLVAANKRAKVKMSKEEAQFRAAVQRPKVRGRP